MTISGVESLPVGARCTVVVGGAVQGVGFRPFVYRLATRHGLGGSVRNSTAGVVIEVEGDRERVEEFLADLVEGPPARPTRVAVTWDAARGAPAAFSVEASCPDGAPQCSVPPDLAPCKDCLREIGDAADRRVGHPFAACTACGPRFTIVQALPYDRERTTMAAFAMCRPCRAEYGDPLERRFHAEPIACPDCGPAVTLHDRDGKAMPSTDPIRCAASALRSGRIVAVKGVGGYHLACDATNAVAVGALRRRKRREAKPLAIMVAGVDAARALCSVSDEEAALLISPARPIVLLRALAPSPIAPAVAPGCRELGVLLPPSPLHHLLVAAAGLPLVMTSGNASDEPIAYEDDDARARLGDVADLFLGHDRSIAAPCDDSVIRVVRGQSYPIRRSRGYVPQAVALPVAASRPILACGGELKSVFALARGSEALLGQHLGDLTDERAFRAFGKAVEHLATLFGIAPEVVAHDLHPGYRSTAHARGVPGAERIAVQHHHAHVASCLADNGVDRLVIGVAWDGTGHGADGTVWGGEFLLADLGGFERAGHLEPVPMPGGDVAIREPWRMAAAFLHTAYGQSMSDLDLRFVSRLDPAAWRVLSRAAERGLNAPLTSSAGRLFDAIASLLGLRDRVDFEAQAAIELEALAGCDDVDGYPVRLDGDEGPLIVRSTDLVRGVVDDLLRETPAATISARFHATLAEVIAEVSSRIGRRRGVQAVALSGGVFQNVRLLEATTARLESRGFEVYRHRQVPPNDGGLALGQAAVAARSLARAS